MKTVFMNEYGTKIEIIDFDNRYVTFKINTVLSTGTKTDFDCWNKESFEKMIAENGYKAL